MKATLLDGRLVSQSVLGELAQKVAALQRQGITPKLVIVRVGENPASISYIRQKHKAATQIGVDAVEEHHPDTLTQEALLQRIRELNTDPTVHGMIVQLPLPAHINPALVIREIDPKKDVDGFHAYNIGKMFLSTEFEHLAPCTPRGIIYMLEYYKIPLAGKHVVIVGRSNIVGKPLGVMMLNRDATVTMCHSKTPDLSNYTLQADILVAAVGRPGLITKSMVKPGAVVVDVGMNKVENALVGDVDFESVAEVASFITPVPGGVGPMTVACLMENVIRASSPLIKE